MGVRWLAAAALVAACGGAQKPACPAQGGHAWYEVRTEHFDLITDLSEHDAKQKAIELEQTYMAIVDLSSALILGAPRLGERIRVLHFRDYWDYAGVGRESTLGYATRTRDGESRRAIVTPGATPVTAGRDQKQKPEHVLRHELMHAVVAAYVPYPAPWLTEGLAEFVETLEVRDGEAVLGQPPPVHVRLWVNRVRGDTSLRDLLEADRGAFHDGPLSRFAYYNAWRLVHMLNNSSAESNARFKRYLGELAAGKRHREAWEAAFGDASFEALSEKYDAYVGSIEIKQWTTPYSYRAPSEPPEIRKLRDGEVHAAWGELTSGTGDERVARVERQLALMLEHDPDWDQRYFWQAVLTARVLTGDDRQATLLELHRKHLALNAGDPRALHQIASVRMDQVTPEGYLGLDDEVPASLPTIEDDVRALVRVAHTPSQLNTVAWYYALVQQPETGLGFAMRALAQRPGYAECIDTLALLLFQSGRFEEAADMQERAVGMFPHGAPDGMTTRLERFREAASR